MNDGPPETARHHASPRRRSRTIIWRLGIGALAILAVVTVGIGVLVRDVLSVRDELTRAQELVPTLRSQVMEKDLTGVGQTLAQLDGYISDARSKTSGPVWKGATVLPLVGPNLSAVSEVLVSADEIVSGGLTPLLGVSESLNWASLSPVDGHISYEELAEAEPSLSAAAATIQLSYERMSRIDSDSLLPEVADPIRELTTQVEDVRGPLWTAASAARLLPPMLGADGERNYLLLIQNNSEARATGGIPGALAVLRTHDGRIDLAEQSSASALGEFVPAIPVEKEQEGIFSSRIGKYMQSVNLTPDFPTAASTAKRMWEERHPDQSVDGVLALDPVVLAHLLKATGPVALTDPVLADLTAGTAMPTSLTSDNVVTTLLSDVYGEIREPSLQDLYFASAASQIFTALTDGGSDASRLVEALGQSAQEQRLYLWSAHESEQEIISQTPLASAVNGSRVGGASFGMYFNDGTGAKMDFYAARTVQLFQGCRSDGYGEYTLRVSITNNAPADARDSLPAYVTGGGAFGVEPGHIRTNYVAYGPAQSLVQTARLNNNPIPFASGFHGQRPVGTVSVELAPGETAELEFTFVNVVQDGDPKLSVTPTVDPLSDVVLPPTKQPGCK